jgi:hypothetical protein
MAEEHKKGGIQHEMSVELALLLLWKWTKGELEGFFLFVS